MRGTCDMCLVPEMEFLSISINKLIVQKQTECFQPTFVRQTRVRTVGAVMRTIRDVTAWKDSLENSVRNKVGA